ncbi:MAG: TonB-dependent receptor, partial [Terriglobia bacterium]
MASLRGLLIVVGLVGVQLLPDIVIAQTTTADTDAVQLQEVVVTAEKRTSTVQQTPLSLTAITGAELSALGMSSAQDILRAVPGLSAASAGPGQASYEIRGIAATGGNSPTVGFYLDDIAITPPVLAATGMVQIDPSLYDLERVEVLRGPQGTLYGASAMGGAIKLITNQPNPSQFDGSARVTLSGTEGGGLNYGFNAMVNLPINQYAAIRIVGTHEYRSGWIDRIVEPNFPLPTNGGTTRNNVVADSPKITIPDVNDEVVDDYRASLLFAPTDDFKMTPMIMYQEINMGGYDTFDDPPGVSEMATYQPFNVPESFLDKFIVYSLPMTYSFDTFSATSESGYWSRATNQWQDDTEELQALFQFPGFSTADGG